MSRLLGYRDLFSDVVVLHDRVLGIDYSKHELLHWHFAGGEPFRRDPFPPRTRLVASRSRTRVLAVREHGKHVVDSLERYDLETGVMEPLVEAVYRGDGARHVAWSLDESRIGVALDDCGVAIVELATGAQRRLDELPPDCIPFGWIREGLLVCEPSAREPKHGPIWCVGETVQPSEPIWEAPDGSRRVRADPRGIAIDDGSGWRVVELERELRNRVALAMGNFLRPPWIGSRHWLLRRSRLELETGALRPLVERGIVVAASADGSIVVVDVDRAFEIVRV